MKKILFIVSILFMFLIPYTYGYNYEILTDYANCGATCKTIRFDDPDEMNFRQYLLANSETHKMNATTTFFNYTPVFVVNYHLYYNNSDDDMVWDNLALIWDGNSPNLNNSMGLFMYQNGSRIHHYKFIYSVISESAYFTMFAPARHLNISYSTSSNYGQGANLAEQSYGTDVLQELEAINMMSLATNFTGDADNDYFPVITNHFLNANFYYTSWYDAQYAYYILTQPEGKYFAPSVINYSETMIVRSYEDGYASMLESTFVDLSIDTKEGTNSMCYVAAQSIIANNSVTGARLSCGDIGFAFAANFAMDFTDSVKIVGDWVVQAFWGIADVYVKYTLDYMFRDNEDNNVTATYTVTDVFGTEYTGTTDHMQPVVIAENHYGTTLLYVYTDYRPMNLSANASDNFTRFNNYSISPTSKHVGQLLWQRYTDLTIHSLYWDDNAPSGAEWGSG